MLEIIRVKNGKPDDPAGGGTVWKRSTNLFAKIRVQDRFPLKHVESGVPRLWYSGYDLESKPCGWSLGSGDRPGGNVGQAEPEDVLNPSGPFGVFRTTIFVCYSCGSRSETVERKTQINTPFQRSRRRNVSGDGVSAALLRCRRNEFNSFRKLLGK